MTNLPNLAQQITQYGHEHPTLHFHLWNVALRTASPDALKAMAEDLPTTDPMGEMLASTLRTLARERNTTPQESQS